MYVIYSFCAARHQMTHGPVLGYRSAARGLGNSAIYNPKFLNNSVLILVVSTSRMNVRSWGGFFFFFFTSAQTVLYLSPEGNVAAFIS